jgi:hypothetical protein
LTSPLQRSIRTWFLLGYLSRFLFGDQVGMLRQGRPFQIRCHIVCQVASSTQVAPDEPDIAIDNILQHDVALSCDLLNANVQLGRSIHGSNGRSSLATGRIVLHYCL